MLNKGESAIYELDNGFNTFSQKNMVKKLGSKES